LPMRSAFFEIPNPYSILGIINVRLFHVT